MRRLLALVVLAVLPISLLLAGCGPSGGGAPKIPDKQTVENQNARMQQGYEAMLKATGSKMGGKPKAIPTAPPAPEKK